MDEPSPSFGIKALADVISTISFRSPEAISAKSPNLAHSPSLLTAKRFSLYFPSLSLVYVSVSLYLSLPLSLSRLRLCLSVFLYVCFSLAAEEAAAAGVSLATAPCNKKTHRRHRPRKTMVKLYERKWVPANPHYLAFIIITVWICLTPPPLLIGAQPAADSDPGGWNRGPSVGTREGGSGGWV